MSLEQTIRCDRCGQQLSERGAFARSEVRFDRETYLIKSSVVARSTTLTDLCETCLAAVLVMFSRLILQDLGKGAKAA